MARVDTEPKSTGYGTRMICKARCFAFVTLGAGRCSPCLGLFPFNDTHQFGISEYVGNCVVAALGLARM